MKTNVPDPPRARRSRVRVPWLHGWLGIFLCVAVSTPAHARAEAEPAQTPQAQVDSLERKAEQGIPDALMDVRRTATGQTVDVVRWLAKRRQLTLRGVPYGFTGLPIFYYSIHTGLNYGARIQWSDYRRVPYQYKITLQTLNSTDGRTDMYVRIKVPRISDTGFGVILLLRDKRDIRARYYGLGNHSRKIDDYMRPSSPRFIDKDYYYYVLEEPRFIFRLMRHIRGPVRVSAVIGGESTHVSPRGRRAYYLDEGTPDGVRDGATGFIGATLDWDTRDDEVVPKRGVFHEWSYETSRNSVLALFLEEIDFQRYTFTDMRYYPLTSRINLAQRTVFEVLTGSVPLYAYGEVGGERRIKGLGGGESLRGFDSQRFTDNVRFFTNTELRYHLGDSLFYRQHLEWHGVLFLDTGRVWPTVDKLTLRGLHISGGLGLRMYWNEDFVVRFSLAASPEQVYTPIKYHNIF